MIKLVTLFACAINAAVPRTDILTFNSNENDQLLQKMAMSMLVRQALAAQPPMDEITEEEMQDREKRGKIFLPTLF